MTEQQAILQMQGIHKRFPGVVALKNVGLRLFPGEVHALMGQNGAGKSTLIKVLTGVESIDSGDIILSGKPIRPHSVFEVQELGISTVYQEVNLCPNLSVAENIFIGRFPFRFGRIDWKTMQSKARTGLAALNIDIDVSLPLSSYPVAIQQMVAIARALSTEAQVLILDEPTSSLDEDEVERLFDVLRRLKAKGIAILFVTHFLDQTYAISDRITVLRNGEFEGEYLAKDLSRMQLINKMVGREVDESSFARQAGDHADKAQTGEPFLAANHLGRAGMLRPIDLSVYSGQVLGLGGLLGSGRTETAHLLFGIDHPDSGSTKINGIPVKLNSPRKAVRLGLAFCPEDRKTEGIIAELSIRENIILALQARRGIFHFIPVSKQRQIAEEYIRQLGIKTSDAEKPIGQLSGGNQQKVLLARWLATEPKMLILDEPTRGIDVAAKLEIMELVKTQCCKGLAIVFISSEMSEVLRVSDRIAVLRDREKIGELDGASSDEQSVFCMIAGSEA
jgi:galactofuranose transport system ATP-binding protein